MLADAMGAEFRRYLGREHEGKPARVVRAVRNYRAHPAEFWDAVTNHERIPRWFIPIEGKLRLGGRYQLKGNAGGSITRCKPPEALDVTWEFMGDRSWVTVVMEDWGFAARTPNVLARLEQAVRESGRSFPSVRVRGQMDWHDSIWRVE